MGAQISVSSLHRLRHRLLVASKVQGGEEILFFLNNRSDLSLNDCIAMFGRDASKEELERICCVFEGDEIPLDIVLLFLRSGRLPLDKLPRSMNQVCNENSMRPSKIADTPFGKNTDSMVLYAERSNETKSDPTIPTSKENVWKKHETIISAKIVRLTTVKDGVKSELVERDKSQNDIVHIECSATGDFAHREYSQQEQCEKINNEISTFIRASEEYVHFKSNTDEYEYIHTEIPTNNGDSDGDSDGDDDLEM